MGQVGPIEFGGSGQALDDSSREHKLEPKLTHLMPREDKKVREDCYSILFESISPIS